MKNRKGFTLIELLAVIIILGILLLLAIPSVTKYIEKSRIGTYRTNLVSLVDAVRNEVNSLENEYYNFTTSECLVVPLTCINVDKGNKDKSSFGEHIQENSFVLVTRSTDNKKYEYYVSSKDEMGYGTEFVKVEDIVIEKLNSSSLIGIIQEDISLGAYDFIKTGKEMKVIGCSSLEIEDITTTADILLRTKILEDNDEQDGTDLDYSKTSEEDGTSGLYYTSTNTEDNKVTYYFRGTVDNNYVKFGKYQKKHSRYRGYFSETDAKYIEYNNLNECQNADEYNYNCSEHIYANVGDDMYWRIVRINEDGSIRLIYQGNDVVAAGTNSVIGFSSYSEKGGDNAYVGYMHGTPESDNYEDTHLNKYNSTIKNILDDWYVVNLSSYASYLADSGFCNDRSVAPQAGLWNSSDTALGYKNNNTYYGTHNRLDNNNEPQFECSNASQNLFTLSTNIKGNQALTNPIGLITADEAVFAGTVEGKRNSSFYLNKGVYYWTISPSAFYGSESGEWCVAASNSSFGSNFASRPDRAIVPVINLKSDVEIISGDGKVGTEYVIK